MDDISAIPRFPTLPAQVLRRLPLALLDPAIGRIADGVAERHPAMFVRLGTHAGAVFLIDPIDLPFAIVLRPNRTSRRVEAVRRESAPQWDARITGLLAAFFGLVHGAYDGDALFFSRDLTIEGDTEAVVALRNALDDAEIDLSEEALATLGLLRRFAEGPFRLLLPFAEHASGVSLTRINTGRDGQ